MEWGVEYKPEGAVMNPQGRIDSATAKPFEDVVLEEMRKKPRCLVVSFQKVDYINSAGLRVLLIAAKQQKAAGGSFSVCEMSDKIRQVFDVSGFNRIIAIHPRLEDALKG
jgi:anti-anti-sigma factor